MREDDKIRQYLDDISRTLFVARRCNALWWELCGEKRPIYVDTMNEYVHLFRAIIAANFDAGIIALYKVIDKRKGTKNIGGLLDLIEGLNSCSGEDVKKYREKISSHMNIINGIKFIRGNAIGHSSENFDYLHVFKEADLKFSQWKLLIDELVDIVCDIYYKVFRIRHEAFFHKKAVSDVEKLFKKLSS